jgi:hypothetical protein
MGRTSTALIVLAAVALACGGGVLIGNAVAGTSTPGGTEAAASTPANAGAGAQVVAAPRTIDDGTWRVGDEVKAGTYVATVPDGELCSWQRLRGFSGGADDLIDIGVGEAGTRMRVTIKKTDAGFETSGCGPWKPAKP